MFSTSVLAYFFLTVVDASLSSFGCLRIVGKRLSKGLDETEGTEKDGTGVEGGDCI
jgi:hypothetical protein